MELLLLVDSTGHQPPECSGGPKKEVFYPLTTEEFELLKVGDTKTVKCPEGNDVRIDVEFVDNEKVYRCHCDTCDLEGLFA